MGKVEKIEIDAELLARARAAGLSIEQFLETQLRAALSEPGRLNRLAAANAADPAGAEARARQWAKDSAKYVESHNRFVEELGEFGKDWRGW